MFPLIFGIVTMLSLLRRLQHDFDIHFKNVDQHKFELKKTCWSCYQFQLIAAGTKIVVNIVSYWYIFFSRFGYMSCFYPIMFLILNCSGESNSYNK